MPSFQSIAIYGYSLMFILIINGFIKRAHDLHHQRQFTSIEAIELTILGALMLGHAILVLLTALHDHWTPSDERRLWNIVHKVLIGFACIPYGVLIMLAGIKNNGDPLLTAFVIGLVMMVFVLISLIMAIAVPKKRIGCCKIGRICDPLWCWFGPYHFQSDDNETN